MFCPRCGTSQSDELKFCKSCGANLGAVRQAVDTREPEKAADWTNNWVVGLQAGAAAAKQKAEIERWQGITPEVKRYNEIKAGVITTSVGIAITILLFVLMQGIIVGGKVPNDTAEILRRLWVAGVIPLFIGISLIINGVFVSKKQAEITKRNLQQHDENALEGDASTKTLGPANTNEFVHTGFSVTEHTTKHLASHEQK